jgi:hypothetical protein
MGHEACLFMEFTFRYVKRFFAFSMLSFRNGPCSLVLFCPEWPAWMDQKDLQPPVLPPIHDQTCTALRHQWITGGTGFASLRLGRRIQYTQKVLDLFFTSFIPQENIR